MEIGVLPAPLPALRVSRTGWARPVVVGGGRMGVGCSLLSSLLALGCVLSGAETLLIEVDGSDGVLSKLLGVQRDVDGMMEIRRGLNLVRGASVARIGRELPVGRFDLVILDAGWKMDLVLEACTTDADRVLVVTTPDRSTVSAAYGLMKSVEGRFPGSRFEIVINRHDQQDDRNAEGTFDHLQMAAMTFLRRGIALAGMIPEDACLRAGTRGGMTVEDAAADSEVAWAVGEIVQRLLRGAVDMRAAGAGSSPRRVRESFTANGAESR